MKRLSILIIVLSIITFDVLAETTRRDSGGASGAAAAKAQYMMRQIAAERDSLKTKNAHLETEKEKLEKEIASLKAKVKSSGKQNTHKSKIIDGYKEHNEALKERIVQQRERMEEIVEKFKATVVNLRQVEAAKTKLTGQVKNLDREVRSCAKNNVMLFEAGLEALDQYKNKGVWDSLSQSEPVTGLKEVEIQNLVQEYRHRMKQERYYNEMLAKEGSQ